MISQDIKTYNHAQIPAYKDICIFLADVISEALPKAEAKVWHKSPVWFIEENPIVGYCVRKDGVQLLFWSGQSFETDLLTPVGKTKAAEQVYQSLADIKVSTVLSLLKSAKKIQWDYKNIVKNKGKLTKLGTW
jgi:hypothetical protein